MGIAKRVQRNDRKQSCNNSDRVCEPCVDIEAKSGPEVVVLQLLLVHDDREVKLAPSEESARAGDLRELAERRG